MSLSHLELLGLEKGACILLLTQTLSQLEHPIPRSNE
jgi:hypothetical protein